MSTFTRTDLRAALGTPAPVENHPCPNADCTAFPFENAAELVAHIASGEHVGAKHINKFAQTGIGVTDNSARPQFARVASATAPKAASANQYPGPCTKCGARVEALAGTRGKVNGKWVVTHVVCPAVVAPTAPVAPAAPAKVRSNQYPAKCVDCRKSVPAEAGRLTKNDADKWEVRHLDGECPATEFPFPYGKYALTVDGIVKFYDASEDGLYAQGSDDYYPLTSGAKEVIAAIAADPISASKLYGKELGCCGRCGRSLTSEWRKEGIGPYCAGKAWA